MLYVLNTDLAVPSFPLGRWGPGLGAKPNAGAKRPNKNYK